MTIIKTALIILILIILAIFFINFQNDFVDGNIGKGTFIFINKVIKV